MTQTNTQAKPEQEDYFILYERQDGAIDITVASGSRKNYDATLQEIQRASNKVIANKYGLKLDHPLFNQMVSEIKGKPRLEVSGQLEDLVKNIPEQITINVWGSDFKVGYILGQPLKFNVVKLNAPARLL